MRPPVDAHGENCVKNIEEPRSSCHILITSFGGPKIIFYFISAVSWLLIKILVSSIYHETIIRQGVWLSININGSPQNEENEDFEE